MTAAEVKDALRRRHPANAPGSTMIGEWTTLEEFLGIDLLAISAWSSGRFRRVGYEVKVGRGDYRRELLKPHKRKAGVAFCHDFYFAVPEGLLTAEEVAYDEPEWDPRDFVREACPARCYRDRVNRVSGRSVYHKERTAEHPYGRTEFVACATCAGRGYLTASRVELEAPTLWVPRDVGLVAVSPTRSVVVKQPKRRPYAGPPTAEDRLLAQAVRHASARPDPRHRAGTD